MDIKIRLWDKEKKKMYHQRDFWFFDDEYDCVHFPMELEGNFMSFRTKANSTLLFYIGLNDSYGTEIFNGDIVLLTYREGIEEKMVVRYKEEKARFCLIDENGYEWGFNKSNNLKVIGNIYENPNLLEGNHEGV